MVQAVEIGRFISKADADTLRDYADMIERGEITHYAFTAEHKNTAFLYSHASPKRTTLIGLLSHHIHELNAAWQGE